MKWWSIPGLRRRRIGAERGFTLLETMVALLILALAVTAALEAIGAGLHAQARQRSRTEAAVLAEVRMTEMTLLSADSLRRFQVPVRGRFPPPFERYHWSALARPSRFGPPLVDVAVQVEWEDGVFNLESSLYPAERPPAVMGGIQ